jgi:hypothetical protein
MRAAAALLSIRPSSGTEASKLIADFTPIPFKQPLIAPQVDALTDQFEHHPMHLLVLGTERLKVNSNRLAEFGQPHGAEPAGLGVDHVLDLVAAAREFRKCLADCVFRQFDVIGFAASHLIGRGSIGCQQPGI